MTLFASCESDRFGDELSSSDNGGITFLISSPVNEETWQTRSDDGEAVPEHIESMLYMIADGRGNVLDHYYSRLSPEFDRLNVDGLAAGDYSIVFLASSEPSAFAEIGEPAHLDEAWLSNTLASLPLEGSYFFKKLDFSVSLAPDQMSQEVVLDRALAKVTVQIPGLRAAVEEMISSVTITLDDNCSIYSALNADGSFSGEATIANYEMRDSTFNLSFTTLPAAEPISGTVKIASATLSGDAISSSYHFDNIKVEPGKVANITVNLQHPDFETGFILIRPKDYYDYDADLMMMADEPLSVLHDSNHRRYTVCKPLTISNWENNMRVRLFMAGPVEDVDIYANFPSLGIDSVHIAHMDRVEPLLDMLVPMPFMERSCHYFDKNGKRVTIPKLNTMPEIEWSYTTPNAYLKQLSELKFQNWQAWCPGYENYWADISIPPTCFIIRHGFIINQCLAILFDSEEFYEVFAAHEGEYIDNTTYLTNEDILNRIYNTAGFGWGSCNPASGAGGWGGGSTMIFMAGNYNGPMYPGNSVGTVLTWAREVLFHEHGHCLGFSHVGNMTYGSLWVTLCSGAYIQCYLNGKMPFGTAQYINSIPYNREDAPKWAKPRFAIKEDPEAQGAPAVRYAPTDVERPIE